MNLLNIYKKYKYDFPNYLIFITSGEFIEILEDDAYIMHYLLNYKILEKKKFKHAGFPKNKLKNVIQNLKDLNILLVEKNGGGSDFFNYQRSFG